ncbi:hypothetical protein O181_104079 [Austropuccinia psidii MF-1]|uniref:Uncharacterized protein n=1 Tax=Austropuccinia psidii MF-1 TaxID=1389203 RepID=A0A9Q3PJT9_9BASI|nr:hypothetical protein [Austropuccinia psidii MF-1]
MHPFDAPFWGALPTYGTDAGVIQVNVRTNNDWPHLFIAPAHCQAATCFHMHPPTGHTQANFTSLEDLLLPVCRPAICLVGCIIPGYDR